MSGRRSLWEYANPRKFMGLSGTILPWVAISGGALTESAVIDFGTLLGDSSYEFSFFATKESGVTEPNTGMSKYELWLEAMRQGPSLNGVPRTVTSMPMIPQRIR